MNGQVGARRGTPGSRIGVYISRQRVQSRASVISYVFSKNSNSTQCFRNSGGAEISPQPSTKIEGPRSEGVDKGEGHMKKKGAGLSARLTRNMLTGKTSVPEDGSTRLDNKHKSFERGIA